MFYFINWSTFWFYCFIVWNWTFFSCVIFFLIYPFLFPHSLNNVLAQSSPFRIEDTSTTTTLTPPPSLVSYLEFLEILRVCRFCYFIIYVSHLNVDSDLQAEESPPRRQSLLWSQEMEAKVADYSITFVNDIPQENSPFFKGKERWSL